MQLIHALKLSSLASTVTPSTARATLDDILKVTTHLTWDVIRTYLSFLTEDRGSAADTDIH
jgi:hypothetical protein